MLQDPYDSQSYNRYSYVRNNPLVFTDPSGHSWLSKLWHHVKKYIRTIAAIAVAAVIAIYAPQLLVQLFSSGSWGSVTFSAFGTTTAMGTTLSGLGVATVGAAAGFASGAIMTGSLSGALKGAAWGAVSGLVAFGIGEGLGHAGGILTKGVSAGKAFIKAAAHGLSRGIISMAQGGTFKSGFASGFSSSFFSPGTQVGGTGAGGFGLRTSIAAIVGGTASSLGGGKFSNGAVSGAFVHMFNAEKGYLDGVKSVAEGLVKFGDYLARVSGFRDYQQGTGDFYEARADFQTKATYNIIKFIATNSTARSLFVDAASSYASNNQAFVAGRFITGLGISTLSKIPIVIPASATAGDTLYTAEQIDSFARGVILGE